jgi:hypothetical protein
MLSDTQQQRMRSIEQRVTELIGRQTPEILGKIGCPILDSFGVSDPVLVFGSMTEFGNRIRQELTEPGGRLDRELLARFAVIESWGPATDSYTRLVRMVSLAAVNVLLDKVVTGR